ncbi:MAG: S8 family serine peptidase [Candidatus Eremiobacteraeota bacterium]|nr:S8 family serine peptidase [Candidatus Eremiobacteraeota bacterium]
MAAACADSVATAPATASPATLRSFPGSALVPARYSVRFASDAPVALPASAVAASGGTLVDAVPVARALVLDDVRNPAALAAAPGVLSVQEVPEINLDPVRPDEFAVNPSASSASDPSAAVAAPQGADAPWLVSGVQWDMNRMQVPTAWAGTSQGDGARVCIVDTGIDGKHQELAGQVVDSTSFVLNNPNDTSKGYSSPSLDSAGHGSHVAGTVAAKGVVMAGVAPKAKLLIAKVFAATGGTPTDRVVNAIAWCTNHGADVVSMSLGGFRFKNTPTANPDLTYQAGVDYATSRGVVVVASAGNDNVYQPNALLATVPAFNVGVVSVGATGPFSKYPLPNGGPPNYNPMDSTQVWRNADARAYYSNFGPIVTVFAPGGNLSASLNMPYRIVGGVIQGGDLDGIYSVCSSISNQTGFRNIGGAPGGAAVNCLGTTTGYIAYQGTSMAAPHVAGLMALVTAEVGGTRTPARRQRITSCVTKSTDNIGTSAIYGGGRVNAASALALLRSGGC